MSIISISGKAQSGKDTVGQIFQYLTTRVRHSYGFKDFKENAEPVLRSFRRQEHTTDEGEGYTSFGSQHTQEEGNDRRQPQSGRGISGNRQVGRGKDLRHEQW